MKLTYNNSWVPPKYDGGSRNIKIPNIVPIILSISSYYSPAGSTSLVVIKGQNFNKHSIIKFGVKMPVVIFITSEQLEFYVPANSSPGNYPIQVINDKLHSNIVNYVVDNASGYWLLEPHSQSIINTNKNGIILMPPILGLPFFTGYFGVKNNIIVSSDNERVVNSVEDIIDNYIMMRSSSSLYISLKTNNIIKFQYNGTYSIELTLSTRINGLTNYSKILVSLLELEDNESKILQSSYFSGVWNETTLNISFYINIINNNKLIGLKLSSNPYNINISDCEEGFNRIIIKQIG
jgi:hypothetical protein